MISAIENLTQQFKDVSKDVLAIKTDLNTKASTAEVAVLNTNIQSLSVRSEGFKKERKKERTNETFIDQQVARCSQYWLQYIHGT